MSWRGVTVSRLPGGKTRAMEGSALRGKKEQGKKLKRKANREGKESGLSHTNRAYMGIRNILFHNQIAPGQKILYRDIAERLGMSKTPVIQALSQLELQGLVHHEPNKGFYAEQISVKQIREIYELREVVELSLLPKVIRNLDAKAIKRLEKALDAHLTAPREIYLHGRLLKDMEFHQTVAALSGCETHQLILQNLFDLLYLKYRGSILTTRPQEIVNSEHLNISDAIIEKDLRRAKNATSIHLRNIKKHVVTGFTKMLKEEESTFF